MPGNVKYLCTECGWAAKGPCPQHPAASFNMGKNWRPGKKGKRTRLWNNRVHGSVTAAPGRNAWGWPTRELHHPPDGMLILGATDFSHDQSESPWNDPVRVAIRDRNQKSPRPLRIPLARPALTWPFPFNWSTGQHEDPR